MSDHPQRSPVGAGFRVLPDGVPPIALKPACLNLRHKLMYVDERQQARGMVDDSSSTRIFFCACTHDSLGPDDQPVDARSCDPSRPCFRR